MLQAVGSYCEVKPEYAELDQPEQQEKLADVLQDEELEVLMLAKAENATLVTLDGRLRVLLEATCKVNGIWPQLLVMHCAREYLIDPAKAASASIRHFLSNRTFVSLSAWDLVWMSDLTSDGETEIVCSLCQNEFSAYVMNSSAGCYITLDEHPDTEVSADFAFFSPPTDADDWLNSDLPPDPYEIFISSYFHLGDILSEYGVGGSGNLPHSAHLINRMVFTQLVSALEAYLGDTLIKQVLDSEEALQNLLEQDNDLKDVKLSLTSISKNPNIVRDNVKKHLQETLFHNLAKVACLYKIALNIDIWPSEEIKKKLFTAIAYRHDCVHRDGRDKNGQELLVFTSEYVMDVLDAFSSFTKHISESLR